MLPVFGNELGVEPDRVRKYQVEDPLLFGHFQLAVNFSGMLGEFQELGSFFHVVAMGLAVPIQFAFDALQGVFPLPALLLEKIRRDDSVQFVEVDGLQPGFQGLAFPFQLGNLLLVETCFVGLTFAQSPNQEAMDLRVELNGLQCFPELPGQFLLLHIPLGAVAFISGASIVDVLSLFHVAAHGASAVPAKDQPLESPLVFADPCSGLALEVEHFLDLCKQFPGNQRLVCAAIAFPVPLELAVVNRVVQNFGDGAP
ncbi:MAG TPA: hypothetical protein VJ385_05885 [Fibrobacteria bacterium]|nr:hypothetical protein [Fibrobacteria bacterium]